MCYCMRFGKEVMATHYCRSDNIRSSVPKRSGFHDDNNSESYYI